MRIKMKIDLSGKEKLKNWSNGPSFNDKLVSVQQPMMMPSSLLYYIRYKYSKNKGEYTLPETSE